MGMTTTIVLQVMTRTYGAHKPKTADVVGAYFAPCVFPLILTFLIEHMIAKQLCCSNDKPL
jgi:hypothetical protein